MNNDYFLDYIDFCNQLKKYNFNTNYMEIWQEEYKKLPSYRNHTSSNYGKLMQNKYKKTYENSMNRILEERLD